MLGTSSWGHLGLKNQFYHNACKIFVVATTSLQQYLQPELTGVSGTLVCQEFMLSVYGVVRSRNGIGQQSATQRLWMYIGHGLGMFSLWGEM